MPMFAQGQDPLDQPKKTLEEAFCEAMLGAMNALAAQPRPRPRLVIDNDRREDQRAEKPEHDG
jgi:hypothetical protein